MIEPEIVRSAVHIALEEDIGSGDITTAAVVAEAEHARGRIVARNGLVVSGLFVAREVFRQVDPHLSFRSWCEERARLDEGGLLATVEGRAQSILTGERTALNFLQRMSGIATFTRRCVTLAEGSGAMISDTRKTAPGLRAFDREAVRAGGGSNHRAGLFDAILIKDNHWRLAGGVSEAVRRARTSDRSGPTEGRSIEVEVSTLAEMEEAMAAGADAVLLDNMDRSTLREAVQQARGRVFLEVSGGIREKDIEEVSSLGVQRISLGALTQAAPAADIALELESL
jgi:nicotinate-nucleotide pyrophosphorylase (carboxylating)